MALLAFVLSISVETASLCLPGAAVPPESLLVSFFPSSLPGGWQSSDSLRLFEGEELYLLIDGGADIYLEYGFTRAGSRHFASPAGDEVDLEIYEMKEAEAAFGIFSFIAAGTGSEAAYGQAGVSGDDFLIFWKDRFIVSATAVTEGGRIALPPFGRAVEGRIPNGGSRPALVDALLQTGFPNKEVILVKGTLSFDRCAALGLGNLFRVRDGSSGRFDECRTFILQYRDSTDCDSAGSHALHVLEQEAGYREISSGEKENVLMSPKGKWLHVGQNGRYLLLTLGEEKEKVLRVAMSLSEAARTHLSAD